MNRRTALVLLALLPAPARPRAGPGRPRSRRGSWPGPSAWWRSPRRRKAPSPCPSAPRPQDVDINSTLRIRGLPGRPAGGPLRQSRPDACRPGGRGPPHERAASCGRRRTSSRARSPTPATLARLDLEGQRDTPEFAGDRQRGPGGGSRRCSIVLTLIWLPSRPRRARSSGSTRPRRRPARRRGRLWRPPRARPPFLVEEIQWTLEQLETARGKAGSRTPPLALVLSASLVRPRTGRRRPPPSLQQPARRTPKSIDKMSLALTPEQAALQATRRPWPRCSTGRPGQRRAARAARQLLAGQGIDPSRAGGRARRGEGGRGPDPRTRTGTRLGQELESQLRTRLDEATAEQRKRLEEKLLPEVEDLQARAQEPPLHAGRAASHGERPCAPSSPPPRPGPRHPVVALLSLAQVASQVACGDVFQNLRAEVDRWRQAAKSSAEPDRRGPELADCPGS